MLKGKKILVGVTGGIAAYKTATIIRLLVKEGAEVMVLMTEHAKDFITPLTLATLSKNPVLTEFYNRDNGDWNSHIELGIWADLFLIAPATANTIAKMAHGIADNLLLTTYLSSRCPVFISPGPTDPEPRLARRGERQIDGDVVIERHATRRPKA